MSDLEYTVRAPLRLELQSGDVVDVREWSQAGLTYPLDTDVLPKRGHLVIPFQGVDLRFEVNFAQGAGPKDLLFKDLTGRQREIIGVFYRSILSGKMAASEDVITALDTPVDLVPMGETAEEEVAGKAKQKPRFLRVIWNILFYAILSMVLFGLIGGQIWTRLSSVNLSNARVVAPEIIHRAAGAAYVDDVLVAVGQSVSRGDTLIRMTNPEKDGTVDDIRREIDRAEDRIREARQVWQAHLERGDATRASLLAKYQAAVADRRYSDFTSGLDLSAVQLAYSALKAFDTTIIGKPGDFHDIAKQLKRQLENAKEAERRLKRDLGNAKSNARAFDVIAQSDGIVTEIFAFEDVFLPRGTELLVLEDNIPRTVQAWVDEAQAAAIYVGMPVELTLRTMQGQRTYTAEISDISAGIDPITDAGFGMIVEVGLPSMDMQASRSELPAAAPVKARALKSWFRPSWWP